MEKCCLGRKVNTASLHIPQRILCINFNCSIGIALSLNMWKMLKDLAPEIDEVLEEKN
jgi:hypothetical protein